MMEEEHHKTGRGWTINKEETKPEMKKELEQKTCIDYITIIFVQFSS